jgi:hypothetical protein
MVGSVGAIVFVLAYLCWRVPINSGVVCALKWVHKILLDPKTCKVAETFCNEVAVLWFVFPLLDEIYEHEKHPGDPLFRDPLLHNAFWVAFLFLLFAITLSHIAGRQDKED